MSDLSLRYLLFGEDKTASKAVKGVGQEAETTANKIGGAFSRLGGTIGGEVGGLISQVGDGLDQLGGKGTSMGTKLAAGGSAVAGLGVAMSFLGSANVQAQAQLDQAIKNTGHSVSEYSGQINDTIKSMENFGHADDDTQTALRTLTQATNDPKKALDEMGLVANLAAANHISLADASNMVAKVLAGKGARTLAEYGITLTKNKKGVADNQAALDQLAKKLDGQASVAVDNFRGKVDIVKTKVEDWAANTATKLGPALTAAGPIMMVAGTAMQLMTARAAAAAVATDAAAVSEGGATVATGAWATATAILDGALAVLTSPITLIIAGVALLIGAFILAYHKVGWFRDGVQTAFHGVVAAWDFLWGIFSKIPGLIGGVFKSVGSFIVAPFRMAFNLVADIWNNTLGKISFKLPSWIPGLGGKGFSFPTIPHFASGTSFAPGGFARVGEYGPETVYLPRGSAVQPGRGGQSAGITEEGLAAAIVKAFNTVAGSSQVRGRTVTGAAY